MCPDYVALLLLAYYLLSSSCLSATYHVPDMNSTPPQGHCPCPASSGEELSWSCTLGVLSTLLPYCLFSEAPRAFPVCSWGRAGVPRSLWTRKHLHWRHSLASPRTHALESLSLWPLSSPGLEWGTGAFHSSLLQRTQPPSWHTLLSQLTV